MSRTHVVVGAGPVGSGIARALAARGDRVRVVTRSGSGPEGPGLTRHALDAARGDELAAVAAGSDSIVNALNPPYHRWADVWPGVSTGLLGAAEASGALLLHVSNLYGHGPSVRTMVEASPDLSAAGTKGAVRAAVWARSRAAHEAGRVRTVELRASDYFGPGSAGNSHLDLEVVGPVVRRRPPVALVGDPSAPHSWTFLPDLTATVLAVLDAERERGGLSGRVVHVPNSPARSMQQVADDVAGLLGRRPPRVRVLPRPLVGALGLVVPFLRELREVEHQFRRPFVADGTATAALLGVTATPWSEALAADVRALGGEPVAPLPALSRPRGTAR
ncbi:NAD-dependent epimerase/dehydratase family protein [Kineococcus gynurae]|uniref:NAD-dependent epimerase/dehydratase family protein n=1 Tax=Kineococcus gynurae TaxID=452979 RepID=A0ABV5LQ30_9ACTN